MQQSPIARTVRYIVFTIGFVLFVLIAFKSAGQASDTRYVKGKPSILGITLPAAAAHALGLGSSPYKTVAMHALTTVSAHTASPSAAPAKSDVAPAVVQPAHNTQKNVPSPNASKDDQSKARPNKIPSSSNAAADHGSVSSKH